ncbi:hypothetical protein E2C01_009892 [Portunus trituberculatus]|uniref:Uncharacterized protein n=1 Tax=Portunus trituberculatus TaxID=210409 RepID=A0A5B7D6X8_PORTR|nr:hypothetical protein [Portunus trituberculatus]
MRHLFFPSSPPPPPPVPPSSVRHKPRSEEQSSLTYTDIHTSRYRKNKPMTGGHAAHTIQLRCAPSLPITPGLLSHYSFPATSYNSFLHPTP